VSTVHPDPRPSLGPALDALLQHACASVAELHHVKAKAVLLVAGGALDESRASIRGLDGLKVTVDAQRRHYEVTLRPLFFLSSNALGRLITLFHELFHISPAADGTLDPQRRHGAPGGAFDREVETLARRYARTAPAELLVPLGHHGEVLMRQWRIRPSAGTRRASFGDAQMFVGPVRMVTPRHGRTGGF
jgi:hypothetical protein